MFYLFVNYFGLALDRREFGWIGRLALFFHHLFSINLLHLYFSCRYGSNVFIRRDAKKLSYKDYNPFFSDLDIGMTVADTTSEATLAAIKNDFYKIKLILVFLGELETYTRSEFARLTSLLSEHETAYSLFRNFRHYRWLRNSIAENKSLYCGCTDLYRYLYNRNKYHRKIKKLKANSSYVTRLENLTSYLESEVFLQLEDVLLDQPVSDYFCDYLSMKVDCKNKNIIKILSLVPTTCPVASETRSALSQIRNKSTLIQYYYLGLLNIEFLFATAFIRGQCAEKDWHAPWLAHLQSELKDISSKKQP